MFDEKIKEAISKETGLAKKDIVLEIPRAEFGDFAFPCFALSKVQKESPIDIAKDLAAKMRNELKNIDVKPNGPYVNFIIDKELLAREIIEKILKEKGNYGSSDEGKGKKIVFDLSSPNIAKPFSIGHLRSTIIGFSLYRIFNFLGYKSIGINYLGDWGTQFGQLIYAYKKWGDSQKLKKKGIHHLLDLYVTFNKDAENSPELHEKAREWFKKLEKGDKEAVKLWKEFREISLKEFNALYKTLNIKFDFTTGESYYNKNLEKTLELLKNKNIVRRSQNALVVHLPQQEVPCMLKKSDGASTYELRDIAAAIDRQTKFKPEKLLYIVGSEQKLHFEQISTVLSLAGFPWHKNLVHVPFGLISLPEGKLSTRLGRVIFMEDVINKGIALAKGIIEEKNPQLKDKEKIAKAIAIGSIIYGDLSNDRILDIKFDWDKVLSFEGNSAPYLQYSYVRANSIIKKLSKETKSKIKPTFKNIHNKEYLLSRELSLFPKVVKQASVHYKPNIIANYCYSLSQLFNDFYESCPVMNAEEGIKERRVMLVKATKQVLENCLNLLLIPIVQEM